MLAPLVALTFVLPLAVFTMVVLLVSRAQRRRRALRQQRAAEVASVGWYPAPPSPWLLQLAANLFQDGEPGESYAGEYLGRGMCVFDYTYATSNGKTQQTQTVNLIALTLPAALPPLTVRRDNGVGRMFRGRDLELENAQFNDNVRVECDDDRYGSAILHPRTMEYVLHNPALEWQIAGNAFISWNTGAFTVPDAFARLDAMTHLIDLIPPFVLRDYGRPAY